jgi:hypothetical protein
METNAAAPVVRGDESTSAGEVRDQNGRLV